MEDGRTDKMLELGRTVNEGVNGGDYFGPLTEGNGRSGSRGGKKGHVCETAVGGIVARTLPCQEGVSYFESRGSSGGVGRAGRKLAWFKYCGARGGYDGDEAPVYPGPHHGTSWNGLAPIDTCL